MDIPRLTKEHGRISAEFITPSGFSVIIREQNGEDDSILSNVALAKDSNSINSFIQSIIVWSSIGQGPLETMTMAQIMDMRLRDKYFILMFSRIFSIGPILKFPYQWGEELAPVEYEEDLVPYIWDFSKPFPKPGEPDYFVDRIKPYPVGVDQPLCSLELASGKKIQYKFMDGHSERYLLKLPEFQSNINSRIVARNLELWVDSKWVKVENFKMFSPADMRELRNSLEEVDEQYDGIIEIKNPYNDGEKVNLNLLAIHDFFYPREI